MNFLLIIKGFIVGLGKIIPGVSGSMLAMTLGVYEKLLDAITNFFSNKKENFKFLLNFGLGVMLAIIFFSKLILFLLNNYYYETMYLFLGLIIGTLIPFTKTLKFNLRNIIIFLVITILMLLISFNKTTSTFIFTGSLLNYLYTILLGIIDAFTSIIPGISGTAIFMLLGVYEYVLTILSNPFRSIFIIYTLGIIVGIILVCYLMKYMLKKAPNTTYFLIFSFMFSSILILLLNIASTLNLYLSLYLLFGLIFGVFLDK